MRTRRHTIVLGVGFAVAATLVGCGDSGASRTPTITVKRAEKEPSGAANGSATPDQTPDKSNGQPAPAAGFGTFSGRVVLTGDPPPKKFLYRMGDPAAKDSAVCAAMDLPDESLVVSADGGVANVFVYLAKPPKGGKTVPPPTDAEEYDQKYCRFKPHALGLRAGQVLRVLNDDSVTHNTHLNPKRGPNTAALSNILIGPNDRKGIEYVYKVGEALPVKVNCDIHSFMIGWQLPVEHPYFAVTDENGRFEIRDLPSGPHEFIIWQEKAGQLATKYQVAIEADKATEKDISFPASSFTAFKGPEPKVLRLTAR